MNKYLIYMSLTMSVILNIIFCNMAFSYGDLKRKTEYDEMAMQREYRLFVSSLDYMAAVKDYPKAIKDLFSGDSQNQETALRILAETCDPRVIPWIVPFLDNEDGYLRALSGYSIEKIVSDYSLRRRDMSRPDKVVLKPLGKEDIDLRPLAWIALKMFRRADDGNTQAYAATIVRYLELKEFEGELRKCLNSRHPAVKNGALDALESLNLLK